MEKPVKRLPKDVNLDVLDEGFEKLLIDAVGGFVRSGNPRRARRIAGLLVEFRDASQHPVLTEYYARVVGEAFLAALAER